MIWIGTHNKKNTNPKSLQECKESVDSLLKNIIGATFATHYILCLTVGKSFRYHLYPDYKANRKYGDKSEHFDRVKEYLIVRHKAYYQNGLEADDVVNVLQKRIENSFIASADKDVLLLEGRNFDYRHFKWVKTDKKEAYKALWMDMITGQVGDNIKGVEGKGKKFAEKLFQTDKSYGAILNVYNEKYGINDGIDKFFKTYNTLKIVDEWDLKDIPEPIEFIYENTNI